jgi:hypothetical protein
VRPDKSRRVALDLRGLLGTEDIFRVSLGVRSDPLIDSWFAGDPIELRSIARKWFVQMRRCGDDVLELMHDGCPVACLDDAPFAYVDTFKAHVNVGFFNGAMLDDPAGVLEGGGKRMRHVKLTPNRVPNAAALNDLIVSAYLDIKRRLAADGASP